MRYELLFIVKDVLFNNPLLDKLNSFVQVF